MAAGWLELVVFLNATESKLLAILSHTDKVREALCEFGRTFPCRLDEGNANAYVRLGKPLEVLPRLLVRLDGFEYANRNGERLLGEVRQRPQDVFGDLALFGKGPKPLHVRLGVLASGLANRKPLGEPVRIYHANRAIDPPNAQRLFDRIVVGDARPSGVLLVIDEPDLSRGLGILFQPGMPLAAIGSVEEFVLWNRWLHPKLTAYRARELCAARSTICSRVYL